MKMLGTIGGQGGVTYTRRADGTLQIAISGDAVAAALGAGFALAPRRDEHASPTESKGDDHATDVPKRNL